MKVTPWFPGRIKPVRDGEYEVTTTDGVPSSLRYRFLHGLWECFSDDWTWQTSNSQNWNWRGVTEASRAAYIRHANLAAYHGDIDGDFNYSGPPMTTSELERFCRIEFDGSYCVVDPREILDMLPEDEPATVRIVLMSRAEYEALPDFQGW